MILKEKQKKLLIIMIVSIVLSSCVKKIRHEGYEVGNKNEMATVNWHIETMKALSRYPDSVNYDSFSKTYPAVFGKTDYNAVLYHRKYVDTIILDDHLSKVHYDFFYLIDQDICLFTDEYFGYITHKYTKKYRE